DWTTSPYGTRYLAVGKNTSARITIYNSNSSNDLTPVANSFDDVQVKHLAWRPANEAEPSRYLAVVTSSGDINLYQLMDMGVLMLSPIQTIPGIDATTCAWSSDGQFLAIGAASELSVYYFMPSPSPDYLNFAESKPTGSSIASISWTSNDGLPKNIITSDNTTPYVHAYGFNGTSITEPIDYSGTVSANAVISCSPTVESAIAIGYSSGSAAQVGMLQFTGSTLTNGDTHLTITPGTTTNSLDWASDGTQLIATTDAGTLALFSVSGYQLTQIDSVSATLTPATVSFAPNNSYLALGGLSGGYGQTLQLYNTTKQIPSDTTYHTISKNLVTQVTTNPTENGIGIRASSTGNYVAENTCCKNDVNYQLVASEYIVSQENARGVDNIDCSITTTDKASLILQETWSIESKAEVISSKIDTITPAIQPELWSIESKAEVISSKLDNLSLGTPELWSIESKAEVISSKIDTISPAIQPELWSIESKAEVISSKLDNLSLGTPELWSIESKT
ncbi:MAG: hypothetical protein U1E13_07045, partial [Methylophilaceae bacterium]|nr:hypothetical protein [Methylophilaceae bacterium]